MYSLVVVASVCYGDVLDDFRVSNRDLRVKRLLIGRESFAQRSLHDGFEDVGRWLYDGGRALEGAMACR